MTNTPLQPGDRAPEFTLLASRGEEIEETPLSKLLEGKRGVVLTTYVFDFTGG